MKSHKRSLVIIKSSNYQLIQLVCFSFFIFHFSFTSAQTATIYGHVKDSAGQPVPNVIIAIIGSSYPTDSTDNMGNYSYTVPAGKEIIVGFFHPNYKYLNHKIKLKEGEKIEYNPIMSFLAHEIAEVNIVGKDTDRHNPMTELNTKVTSSIPMPSGDIKDLLATSGMGVVVRSELGSEYSVRGGGYDENLVYVNGIEVYRPFLIQNGEQEGLSFVNPDMISSAYFSAGGFEAQYGDKMSSVLDVTYNKPTHNDGSVSGSLLGGNGHLEGVSKNRRWTYNIGARYKTNQYLLKSLDVQGEYRPQFADGQVFITYAINDRLELDILGNVSLNLYNFIPQSQQTAFGTISEAYELNVQFEGQEIDQFLTTTGAVSLNYKASNRIKLNLITSVYNDQESEDYDIEGDYYISELNSNLGSSSLGQAAYNIGVGTYLNHARDDINATVYNIEGKGAYHNSNSSFKLLWGAGYQYEVVTSQISQWNFVDSAGYSLPYNPYILQLQNVVKTFDTLKANRVQGYVEGIQKWHLDSSTITLSAGVRANYSDINNQTAISPRGYLAFKPHWKNDILFRFATGLYYQPPFFRELIDQYGALDTHVKDQESIHYVLGADYNFKAWNRPFKLLTELYYKDLVNIIPYGVNNEYVQYYPEQTAHGFSTGVDMKIGGEFVKGLESWASLGVEDARYTINNAYSTVNYNAYGEAITPGVPDQVVSYSRQFPVGSLPMPLDQRVTYSMFFQDYLPRFPNFKVNLNLIFGTGIPFGPPAQNVYGDTLRSAFYQRVDIGASYLILGKKGLPKKKEAEPGTPHSTGASRYFKKLWIGIEVFNLLQANNVISYEWISDVSGNKFAVPIYLTPREVNFRVMVEF